MTIANITYGLASFADYRNIGYTNDNLSKILNALSLGTLAPMIYPEQSSSGPVSRMQFFNQDGFLLNLGSERLDLTQTSTQKEGFSPDDRKTVLQRLKNSHDKICELFTENIQLPHRLAFTTSYMCFNLDDVQRQKYWDKFIKTINYFDKPVIDSRCVRYGKQQEYLLQGSSEKINLIATLSDVIGQQPNSDRQIEGIRIDYDINTWPENPQSRFDPKAIEEFLAVAETAQTDLDEIFLAAEIK